MFYLQPDDYPMLEYNGNVYVGLEKILDCFKKQVNLFGSFKHIKNSIILKKLNFKQEKH